MATTTMSQEQVHALALRALRDNGMSGEQSESVAAVVTRAELDDYRSHGLYRVPGYVASLRAGNTAQGIAVPIDLLRRIEALCQL